MRRRIIVDLHALRRAIVEGNPKAELLIRVQDLISDAAEQLAREKTPSIAWDDMTLDERRHLVEQEARP